MKIPNSRIFLRYLCDGGSIQRSSQVKVPATRIGRIFEFGKLAVGVSIGALQETIRRSLESTDSTAVRRQSSSFLTADNAERVVETLCRVRGAALKIGQFVSLQDDVLLSPVLTSIFERVRNSANYMPDEQLNEVMCREFGSDWSSRYKSFFAKPFAAASIGQVHKAVLHDGQEVAVKVQYPGVAESIESDIKNLVSLLKFSNVVPDGLFVDNLVRVASREMGWECDYLREMKCALKMRELILSLPHSTFSVPNTIGDFSSRKVFCNEFVDGVTLDCCLRLDQLKRNQICQAMVELFLREVFQWRFMQTDPNWSNFLYQPNSGRVALLDFGACRGFSKEFVDIYIKIIKAASLKDCDAVLRHSTEIGFLTGYESALMKKAHVDSVMIIAEMLQAEGEFDFSTQSATSRIRSLVPVMLSHRLCPPPTEVYSLHRKMSGVFLLCTRLGGKVSCKRLFDNLYDDYMSGKFDPVSYNEEDCT